MLDEKDKNWFLAPYCEVLESNGVLHFGFGSAGLDIHDPEEIELAYEILHAAKNIREFHYDTVEQLSSGQHKKIWDQLVEKRLVVPAIEIPEFSRYHRDDLFFLMSGIDPRIVRRKLSKKCVTIIGCGGIGCMIATTLATAGIGKLILIDHDIVEIHNITRQFTYRMEDIGKKKVTILENDLLARNPDMTIEAIDGRAKFDGTTSNLNDADFYVLAADERGLAQKANIHFVHQNNPFIHICYINDISVWGPLVIPGQTGCWNCQSHIGTDNLESTRRSKILKAINGSYTCPIISPVSLTATSLAALDILKFLSGVATPHALNKRIGLWTNSLEIQEQDFSLNKNCSICGSLQ